jgi:hypothetical protein
LKELDEVGKFTQPAVIFALTGHVFWEKDINPEYKEQCLKEIREDAVYKFVMKTISANMLKSMYEVYDGETLDVDPIFAKFVCSEDPVLAGIKDYVDGTDLEKSTKVLRKKYLNGGYVELSPIDFHSFSSIAEEVHKEVVEKSK